MVIVVYFLWHVIQQSLHLTFFPTSVLSFLDFMPSQVEVTSITMGLMSVYDKLLLLVDGQLGHGVSGMGETMIKTNVIQL